MPAPRPRATPIDQDLQRRLWGAVRHSREQSPLGQWMATHRDDVESLLRLGAMDWQLAAQAFGAAGLTDAHGRPPTAETAEDTWRRVTAAR